MPRAYPVPVYTTLTSTPAPYTTTRRALSGTSPGTTDNTATGINGGTVGVHAYFRPAATITGITGSGTSPASPPDIADGWLLVGTPLLTPAGVPFTVAAGTWTIPYHYSRPGGILTADVPHTVTAILVQLDSAGTTFISEVGRSAAQALTATTTEQSFNFSITGVQTSFAADDCLMLLLYFDRAGALTSDTVRCHTNSTTALRITAAPTYTRQYAVSLSDSYTVTDSVTRALTSARSLSDSYTLSESISRIVAAVRSLSDSYTYLDSMSRQFMGGRPLADSYTLAESVTRAIVTSRSLADAYSCTETLERTVQALRAMSDTYSYSESLDRQFIANRDLSDTYIYSESLDRQIQTYRDLTESYTLVESLMRSVTFARDMEEQYTTGGGGDTYIFTDLFLFDD